MATTILADNGNTSGSGGLKWASDGSGVLALQSGSGTTALTIDGSQNIGIGTSSPATKLNLGSGVIRLQGGFTPYSEIYCGPGGSLWLSSDGGNAGNNNMLFSVGATERMRIDSSGNVGIGVADPAQPLEIFAASAKGLCLRYGGNAASRNWGLVHDINVYGDAAIATSSAKTPGLLDTYRMVFDPSGNVGIGTTAPSARMEISSGATSTVLRINTTAGTGNRYSQIQLMDGITQSGQIYQNHNDGNMSIRNNTATGKIILFTNDTTNTLTYDASGNLGLGVTPSGWAAGYPAIQNKYSYWMSDSSSRIYFGANNYYDGSWKYAISSEYALQYRQDVVDGSHKWFNSPSGTAGNPITFTQAMTLDASGNLLVGTTSLYPAALGGSSISVVSSSAGAHLGIKGYNGSGGNIYITDTHATAVQTMLGHINTVAAFQVQTGGSGGVQLSSGAASWSAMSDERMKDIIEPITNAAEKVSTLRAVIGKYKTDDDDVRRSFLIAQDVQAVLPEAVTTTKIALGDEEDYLAVAYTETIPLLVAAIKELKEDLDATKAELAKLKGQ